MLSISFLLPYWVVDLATAAPRQELRLVAYLHHLYNLDGPVPPILATGGKNVEATLQASVKLERSLTAAAVTVVALLLLSVLYAHNRWATLLSLPAVLFPLIVIADTSGWVRSIAAGIFQQLGWRRDPSTLPMFGSLVFDGGLLDIRPGAGLILASAGSMAIIAGLWFRSEACRRQLAKAEAESHPRASRSSTSAAV